MKELSLNILDIVQNSIKAKASLVGIDIVETDETLEIIVSDNGCGMKQDFLATVTDPFSTTRTTRKVGLGIPLLKLQAEQTGGNFSITSRHESEHPDSHGTETRALYYKNHIDMTPLGDIIATIVILIQCNPHIDFCFCLSGFYNDRRRHCFPNTVISINIPKDMIYFMSCNTRCNRTNLFRQQNKILHKIHVCHFFYITIEVDVVI